MSSTVDDDTATAPPPPVAARDGIEVRGLHRAFGSVKALDGVDLTARAGAVTALVGPNGSGKTTLLLVLAGLLVPDTGSVTVGGFDPVTQGPAARARTGWMPDTFGTWDSLTVREVLLTFAAAYRLSPATGSCPATVTDPASGTTRPASTSSSVVLPEPLGPTSAVTVPALAVSSTPSSALTGPNARCRSRTTMPSGAGRDGPETATVLDMATT